MFNVRATDMVSHPPSRAQQLGRIGHSFSESNLQVLKEDGETLRIQFVWYKVVETWKMDVFYVTVASFPAGLSSDFWCFQRIYMWHYTFGQARIYFMINYFV